MPEGELYRLRATSGSLCGMTVMSFTDARNRLSELIEEVERTHERIEITRHGHAVAVIISPDDLAALEETLDVLSSPESMRQLAESRAAIAAGDVLDADGLAMLMSQRTQPPTGR
jgi:antitoxin YefM